jgi:hypothetical protein
MPYDAMTPALEISMLESAALIGYRIADLPIGRKCGTLLETTR